MKRIERIIDIFINDEKKAISEMVICRKSYDDHIKLLNELYNYEHEYRNNFTLQVETGISIERLNNYNSFMLRLKQTIKQQNNNMEAVKNRLEMATSIWNKKRIKRCSIENLNGRLDQKMISRQGQREQKEQDEMSLLRYQSSSNTHRS